MNKLVVQMHDYSKVNKWSRCRMSLLGTERLNKKIGISRCGPAAVRGATLHKLCHWDTSWEGAEKQ